MPMSMNPKQKSGSEWHSEKKAVPEVALANHRISFANGHACAARWRSATGASHWRRPHRHSACRLAPVRCTVSFNSPQEYPKKFPMLKNAN